MPTVANTTKLPLAVPLPQGKKLRLGPLKTGQVTAAALEHPPLKALVEAGSLEIRDTGHTGGGTPGSTRGAAGGGRDQTTRGVARRSGDG